MQRVAQDWLVLQVLTNGGGLQVGIVTALQFVPLLLLSPWTGALADRVNRRRLLQMTQAATGLLGVGLGALVITNTVNIWFVYLFALLGGVASAFDSPVRQAFVSELVPAGNLPNAVGLSSAAFNAARLIGPAVSGLLIQAVGMAWVFFINGLLFAVPVLTLALMRPSELQESYTVSKKKGQIREGFKYVRNRPDIMAVMIVMGVVSAFGLNFQMTSALMATQVFNKSAGEYGLLGSYMAIGSLAGALMAARRAHPRLRLIIVAAFVFGACEVALALAPSYLWFAVFSVPTGFAALTLITSANSAVQISTDPWIRGRVMSLYSMIFMGSTPLGAPLIGWVGQVLGARWSLGIGAISCLVIALAIGIWGMGYWHVHLQVDKSKLRIQAIGPVERAAQQDLLRSEAQSLVEGEESEEEAEMGD